MKMTTNKDSGNEPRTMEWEMRPGGMLVQRRIADSDRNSVPPPTIRVRVKYGSTYHEVNISSQATFGNNKKNYFIFLKFLKFVHYFFLLLFGVD